MKEEVYEKINDDLPENLRDDIKKYGLENYRKKYLVELLILKMDRRF
ncbi:hypothetical protein LCGC14_1236200 [marine sediment metagenome]|uniref:Uncharacterized protein n=1 Tax=marine sediment metagenome TaxID=412755 RepID=A0A0F9L783_9ZZZZ